MERISFEVRRGEAFGFPGPNGAGKSATNPGGCRSSRSAHPLHHGVVLERATTLGLMSPALLGHVAYLPAMGTLGWRSPLAA